MTARRVDYDWLAATYDQRFGADNAAETGQALRHIAQRSRPGRILEVGCGTGHWLEALAPVLTSLFGLDPSGGMLRQARAKQISACFNQGYAEQLPCADAVFEVVFCVNALHHFAAPQTFIAEAARVLRPGVVSWQWWAGTPIVIEINGMCITILKARMKQTGAATPPGKWFLIG